MKLFAIIRYLFYKSTRNETVITASEAILVGVQRMVGFFVLLEIPKPNVLMEELKRITSQKGAYAEKFDIKRIVPFVKAG